MSREISVDATPRKRLYYSIMADYNLNKSICELIDNVLDIWVMGERKGPIIIDINLDQNQQIITVCDNAGGLPQEDMNLIVGPGHTNIEPDEEVIGFFGVGSKRAVVALSQDVTITSRHKSDPTCRISFDDSWLKDDSWSLPLSFVDPINEGTTEIELHRLRFRITEESINNLREHLGATYAYFLKNDNVHLTVNGLSIEPIFFENWAYPPSFEPRKYISKISTTGKTPVKISITAGLCLESSPSVGEYGFYFYCNNRLITRGLRDYEVGFTTGKIGHPHNAIALLKVIVQMHGSARFMPWNSSKSGLDYVHPVFSSMRDFLIMVGKEYASLSRRWVGQWPELVFPYDTGDIIERELDNIAEANTSYLPELPKVRLSVSDKIKKENKAVGKDKPWTVGLYEGIMAVEILFKKHNLKYKNRICLLILDTTLEIAFKEYLVREKSYGEDKIKDMFKDRIQVHNTIKKEFPLTDSIWKKIKYYYDLRCDFIHKKATAEISDGAIEDYRAIVEHLLQTLFELKFETKIIV